MSAGQRTEVCVCQHDRASHHDRAFNCLALGCVDPTKKDGSSCVSYRTGERETESGIEIYGARTRTVQASKKK